MKYAVDERAFQAAEITITRSSVDASKTWYFKDSDDSCLVSRDKKQNETIGIVKFEEDFELRGRSRLFVLR